MNTKTDIEALMRPRYKVIADYPSRLTHDGWNINDVINLIQPDYKEDFFIYQTRWQLWHKSDFDKYPHLFKPLAWWEDREASEMPEYVKRLVNGKISKVKHHFTNSSNESNKYGCQLEIETDWNYYSYSKLEPATEKEHQDYLQYINNQNKK